MDKYKALYKCRLCGAKFYSATEPTDKATAMAYLVNIAGGVRGAFLHEPPDKCAHLCADGSLGLAVFLGMERQPTRVAEEKTESGLFEED